VCGFENVTGPRSGATVPIAFAHVLPETLRLHLIYRLTIRGPLLRSSPSAASEASVFHCELYLHLTHTTRESELIYLR
jgi:hypothetical protein